LNINQFEMEVYGITDIIKHQQNKMIQDIKKVQLVKTNASDLKKSIRSVITQSDSDTINRLLYSHFNMLDAISRNYELQNEYFHEFLQLKKQIFELNVDVRFMLSQTKLKR